MAVKKLSLIPSQFHSATAQFSSSPLTSPQNEHDKNNNLAEEMAQTASSLLSEEVTTKRETANNNNSNNVIEGDSEKEKQTKQPDPPSVPRAVIYMPRQTKMETDAALLSIMLSTSQQHQQQQRQQRQQRNPPPTMMIQHPPPSFISHPSPANNIQQPPPAVIQRQPPAKQQPMKRLKVAQYLEQLHQSQLQQREAPQKHEQVGKIPKTATIEIHNIPPLSSLEAMLEGVDEALDTIVQQQGGIVDLEATLPPLHPHQLELLQKWGRHDENVLPLPRLPPELLTVGPEEDGTESSSSDSNNNSDNIRSKWVRKARLRLSPLGRPNGWFMELTNRSVAHALLRHAAGARPIQQLRCAWKAVQVSAVAAHDANRLGQIQAKKHHVVKIEGLSDYHKHKQSIVTDSTVRIENCPYDMTVYHFVTFFSRFDLATESQLAEWGIGGRDPVVEWRVPEFLTQLRQSKHDAPAHTTDRKMFAGQKQGMHYPNYSHEESKTVLVHFASPAWARAAVREKQGHAQKHGRHILRLAQYPKQLL